jgi:hypothetical protein
MRVMTLEKIATKGKHNLRLPWTLILHGMVFNLMQMGLMLMLAPFVSDSEPSFFVLKLFFPARMARSSWVLRILRSALNGLIISHWIVVGSNGSIFLLAIINLSKESLRLIGTLSAKCSNSKNTRLRGLLIRKLMFCYRGLFIIMDAFNPIFRWSLAFALASGMVSFVLGGSGSFKLAGKVNLSTYLLFPSVAITMMVALLIVGPPAEKIHILSSEFIFRFKGSGLECGPFRYSRALKPMRIQVGSFYYFQKASVLVILAGWVETCLSVLLSS